MGDTASLGMIIKATISYTTSLLAPKPSLLFRHLACLCFFEVEYHQRVKEGTKNKAPKPRNKAKEAPPPPNPAWEQGNETRHRHPPRH